ncbi:RNA polymerase subunit sigma [Cytobacillus spongiae]|uniref:sigma factor-like helix-turn-helix DNA-binding protein n=1 Tax=Cytobacillus spongiae TaxID=2901381 RepID=UPI001F2489A7|nr:sigma factor-like helix-turn-helix DNA-binding protein [Cytobacillus spongiae]UII57726.1 RNA polymerase subunit sigma [Cytobacillus spongiae]
MLQKMLNEHLPTDIEGDMYEHLKKYCCFLSKNKWDGEDMAHAAWMKALEAYHEVSPPLLKKIAYHAWIDTVRKREREVIREQEPSTQMQEDPSERMIRCKESIDRLMQVMTGKQAIIFTLKEGFLFKSKEIADLLDISETAVKALLYRGKNRLQKQLMLPVWEDQDRQAVSQLLYEALLTEDPTTLIKAILSEAPSHVTFSRAQQPPLCTFSMAA